MDLSSLITQQLPELLKGKFDMPTGQENAITGGIGEAIMGGIKQTLGGNLDLSGIITSLQAGNKTSELGSNVQQFFVNNIAAKLGLSDAITQTISQALPGVVEGLTSKLGAADGLDLGGIIKNVAGDKADSLLGGIKNLFGS